MLSSFCVLIGEGVDGEGELGLRFANHRTVLNPFFFGCVEIETLVEVDNGVVFLIMLRDRWDPTRYFIGTCLWFADWMVLKYTLHRQDIQADIYSVCSQGALLREICVRGGGTERIFSAIHY